MFFSSVFIFFQYVSIPYVFHIFFCCFHICFQMFFFAVSHVSDVFFFAFHMVSECFLFLFSIFSYVFFCHFHSFLSVYDHFLQVYVLCSMLLFISLFISVLGYSLNTRLFCRCTPPVPALLQGKRLIERGKYFTTRARLTTPPHFLVRKTQA